MSHRHLVVCGAAAAMAVAAFALSHAQTARPAATRTTMTITFVDGSKQTVTLRQPADRIERIDFGRSASGTGGGAGSGGAAGGGGAVVVAQSPLTPFVGKWEETSSTGFELITFRASGSTLVGEYAHDNGKITCTISSDGRSCTGTWSEEPSRQPPDDAGDVTIKLSADKKTLTMEWKYGDSGPVATAVLKKVG